MKKCVLFLFFIISLELTGESALAEKPKFSVDFGIGTFSDDTLYQIGGDVHYASGGSEEIQFPLSELTFPLDSLMLSARGTLDFSNSWQLSVHARKNIPADAGTMKDSDWGVWHIGTKLPHDSGATCDPDSCSSGSLDILSESDAHLDAFLLDFNIRYDFLNRERGTSAWTLFAALGNLYEYFDYDIKDLDQWYPSYEDYFGIDLGHEQVNGTVLTYNIQYIIPYVQAGLELKAGDGIIIASRLAYSPFVTAEDTDRHVLRGKVSTGNLDGEALLFSFDMHFNLTSQWFSGVEVDYVRIEAEGSQMQAISGDPYARIDQEVESRQTSVLFVVGYKL